MAQKAQTRNAGWVILSHMSRSVVAIIALSCVASGQSAWRLPATIEVLKDVALEVPAGGGARRGAKWIVAHEIH